MFFPNIRLTPFFTFCYTQVPNNEQISILIQLSDATSDNRLKVKCIGTLECIAQTPSAIEANNVCSSIHSCLGQDIQTNLIAQVIADYLFSVLPTSGQPSSFDAESVIQATSALIDIYSDETLAYDVNFRLGGYLAKLKASLDSIKTVVKTIDRRKEGGKELRRRGDEVRENLVDFIQYRKELRL